MVGAHVANSQGTFQNLGFEAASVSGYNPPDQHFWVSFDQALPGWTGYNGTNQTSLAGYEGISLGGAALCLIDANSGQYANFLISGNYTAVIQAGDLNSQITSSALGQTGLVPVGTESLKFDASAYFGHVSDMAVTFNGRILPVFQLGSGPNYGVYGADISMFAGKTGELRFTVQPISDSFASVFLDDVVFSSQPIPEPNTWVLLLPGAVGLLFASRRQTRLAGC